MVAEVCHHSSCTFGYSSSHFRLIVVRSWMTMLILFHRTIQMRRGAKWMLIIVSAQRQTESRTLPSWAGWQIYSRLKRNAPIGHDWSWMWSLPQLHSPPFIWEMTNIGSNLPPRIHAMRRAMQDFHWSWMWSPKSQIKVKKSCKIKRKPQMLKCMIIGLDSGCLYNFKTSWISSVIVSCKGDDILDRKECSKEPSFVLFWWKEVHVI